MDQIIKLYKKVFKIVVSDAQKQPCTGEGGVAKIKICKKNLFGWSAVGTL